MPTREWKMKRFKSRGIRAIPFRSVSAGLLDSDAGADEQSADDPD